MGHTLKICASKMACPGIYLTKTAPQRVPSFCTPFPLTAQKPYYHYFSSHNPFARNMTDYELDRRIKELERERREVIANMPHQDVRVKVRWNGELERLRQLKFDRETERLENEKRQRIKKQNKIIVAVVFVLMVIYNLVTLLT